MNYKVEFEKEKIKKNINALDKKSQKKFKSFLIDLEKNPKTGIGKPKPLKYKKKCVYSRKINKKDRLVYEILENEKTVLILSIDGHYNDH